MRVRLRRSGVRGGRRRRPPPVLIAAIVVGAAAAGADLHEERQVYAAAEAATDQSLALAQGGQARRAAAALHAASSPRADVYDAIRLARDASGQPPGSDRRTALLQLAKSATAAGTAARPGWGEAQVVRAYVEGLAGDNRQAVNALSASYESAPYIRHSAFWRIGFGVTHWQDLGPATQARVVDEGLWLRSVAPERRDEINAFLRNSPAYLTFVLRSGALRAKSPTP